MATPGVVLGSFLKKVYHLPSCITCIVTIAIQAYITNHYLVTFYNNIWYCWYIADIVSVIVFVIAFVDAFRHLRKKKQGSYVRNPLFKGILGYMPFVYISWLVYSILLAVRLAVIFWKIAPELDEKMMYGPNLLKTGISLSSIIFFLHVIAHVEAEPKDTVSAYITSIIGKVPIDVLDSVQFLEILFIRDTHIFMSYEMHKAIITIGCINLIVPTLKLGILCRWKFGEKHRNKLFETLHLVFDFLIVDVPMLVIRILLWSVHSQDVSVFIIKNILSLCMTVRAIHQHLVDLAEDDVDNPQQGNETEMMEQSPKEGEADTRFEGDESEQLRSSPQTRSKFV